MNNSKTPIAVTGRFYHHKASDQTTHYIDANRVRDLVAELKAMMDRVCREAFNLDDTKSNEQFDDYVLRKTAEMRDRIAELEQSLAIAREVIAANDKAALDRYGSPFDPDSWWSQTQRAASEVCDEALRRWGIVGPDCVDAVGSILRSRLSAPEIISRLSKHYCSIHRSSEMHGVPRTWSVSIYGHGVCQGEAETFVEAATTALAKWDAAEAEWPSEKSTQ